MLDSAHDALRRRGVDRHRKYVKLADRNHGQGDLVPCGCGCGEPMREYDDQGRPRRFLNRHWIRVAVRAMGSAPADERGR